MKRACHDRGRASEVEVAASRCSPVVLGVLVASAYIGTLNVVSRNYSILSRWIATA